MRAPDRGRRHRRCRATIAGGYRDSSCRQRRVHYHIVVGVRRASSGSGSSGSSGGGHWCCTRSCRHGHASATLLRPCGFQVGRQRSNLGSQLFGLPGRLRRAGFVQHHFEHKRAHAVCDGLSDVLREVGLAGTTGHGSSRCFERGTWWARRRRAQLRHKRWRFVLVWSRV